MASSNGVTASEPIAMGVPSRPVASAPKKTSVPSAVGAATAQRISSSVQAIGCTTAIATASRVSATMMSRKVMLPNPGSPPGWAAGTLIAM